MPKHTAMPSRGFTLIEVLVAMAVMALMGLMTWRGLDAMWRTQDALQQRADRVRTLQTALAQWQTDLNRLSHLTGTPVWDWDGKVLRLTRDAQDPAQGMRVVAWTWRQDAGRAGGGDWLRWQSAPVVSRVDWQAAWNDARTWSQTPTASLREAEISLQPLSGWQLYVHRGGSWVNPLSSDAGSSSTPGSAAVPDAVRLWLDLPEGGGPLAGRLTLDWVRPTLSGNAP